MTVVDAIARDTGEVVTLGPRGLEDLPGRKTSVSLELPEKDWSAWGPTLKSVEHSIMWWIGDWLLFGESRKLKWGEKYTKAEEATGRSYGVLAQAKYVADKYDFSSRLEKLGWAHHQAAASVTPDVRRDLLRQAADCGWSVRELKAKVSQANAAKTMGADGIVEECVVQDLHRYVELIRSGEKPTFGAIYADPPWQYDNQGTRAATGNHYNGMSIEELCALPVKDLAAESSHLHLWTTNGFLFECPRIFDAWGFEFRTSFVWVKPQIGIGNYWRNAHEIMLTGVRGDAKRYNDHSMSSWLERGEDSWVKCDRGAHSEKPEQVRALIERASPGPYLELFARKSVERWSVWGNQIDRNHSLFTQHIKEVA
jgi:N6-adenosine-specific RNA methylase IME4